MGLGPKQRDFTRNLHFFSKRNMFVILISKDQFSVDQLKEEIKTFPNMYDTQVWGAIFPLIQAVKVEQHEFGISSDLGIFCQFFKFSPQINPEVLKRIEQQNNPNIYPGYSFEAPKMLYCGELEKLTNHNFFFIFQRLQKTLL